MTKSKHDQQVEQDMKDADARETARLLRPHDVELVDDRQKKTWWQSLVTKVKRAIGAVP